MKCLPLRTRYELQAPQSLVLEPELSAKQSEVLPGDTTASGVVALIYVPLARCAAEQGALAQVREDPTKKSYIIEQPRRVPQENHTATERFHSWSLCTSWKEVIAL